MTARNTFDTLQNASTPVAGHYADLETKIEQLVAIVNVLNAKAADSSTQGAIAQVYTFAIPDAATADYDIVVDDKIEVVDVVVQKRAANGGAANTVQIKSTANAISDAISININDTLLARAASINDANSTIVAGGILRCSATKAGGNAACLVTVLAILRA